MTLGDSFEAVLASARQGQSWAWSVLYRDLARQVHGYLASRGARDPEDATSETFLQVARGLHAFGGDEQAFRSWVFVIAHRRLVDEVRQSARRPVEVPVGASVAEFDDRHSPGADLEALDDMAPERVAGVLRGLTSEQRDVLMLRIVGDFSVADTAKIVGRSVGAVKVAQHRALAALRKKFRVAA